jgi:hypothetical protein
MRLLLLGLLPLVAACAGSPAPFAQSCAGFGLAPGTPEYQRCQDAKTARQQSGTHSAIDTIRSIDVIQMAK